MNGTVCRFSYPHTYARRRHAQITPAIAVSMWQRAQENATAAGQRLTKLAAREYVDARTCRQQLVETKACIMDSHVRTFRDLGFPQLPLHGSHRRSGPREVPRIPWYRQR